LIKEKKKELLIEITNKCPFNCIFCSSNSNIHKNQFIEKSSFFEIISNAKELQFDIIQLSGGEPFLHPDIEEFIDFIVQKNLFLEIYTCGNIYRKERYLPIPNKILMKFKNYPKLSLRFNFQTVNQDIFNTLTRCPHGLNNLIETMKRCIKYKIKSEVHIIPIKYNLKQLNETIEFLLNDLKIKHIKILRFIPHGRGMKYNKNLKINIEILNDYLSKIKRKYEFSDVEIGSAFSNLSNSCIECQAAKNKYMISFDLKLFPCTAFKNQNTCFVQINNENTLRSILQFNLLNKCLNNFNNNLDCNHCLDKDICREICPIQKKYCKNFSYIKEIKPLIQTTVQNYNKAA